MSGDIKTVRELGVAGFAAQPSSDFKPFRFVSPEDMKRSRALVPLARTDILLSMVQVFRDGGGEQEMHLHTAMDGFWFVLRGRARFYGEGDVLVADLGQHEGIMVPRNTKYWFESAGDERLELLQVEAVDHRVKNEVIRFDAAKTPATVEVYTASGELIEGSARLGG